jgi:hypothetical protein
MGRAMTEYVLKDETIWHLDRHVQKQQDIGSRWTFVDVDALRALIEIAKVHRGLVHVAEQE